MNQNSAPPPLVSIITLNWNGIQETIEFLESSRKLTYPSYEILVCDMNSIIDPTIEIDQRSFPYTQVLRSDKNLGFAGGNNWGMRQAKGEFYFIVNNDTILCPDIIEQLLKPFTLDNKVGFVCPKIKYYSNPAVIQYAGFNALNFYTARTTAVGRNEIDKGQFDVPGYTNLAHGCAMLVPKHLTLEIGKFPEEFFLYYEEVDWSLRLLKSGYFIYFQPDAVIFHKESMSVGKDNPLKIYYMTRNRILLMRRNASTVQLILFYIYFIFFAIPYGLFRYMYNGKIDFVQAFLKGIIWNLRNGSDCKIV
jgi:GT2 family glycosyltransferase